MTLINKTTTTKNKFQHPGTHERRRHYSSNWPNARSNSSVVPLPPQECPPWTTSMNNYKFLPWVLSGSLISDEYTLRRANSRRQVSRAVFHEQARQHQRSLLANSILIRPRGHCLGRWMYQIHSETCPTCKWVEQGSGTGDWVLPGHCQLSSATIVEEWG